MKQAGGAVEYLHLHAGTNFCKGNFALTSKLIVQHYRQMQAIPVSC